MCVPDINRLLAGHDLEHSRTLDIYKNADATMAKSAITKLLTPSLVVKCDAYWTGVL